MFCIVDAIDLVVGVVGTARDVGSIHSIFCDVGSIHSVFCDVGSIHSIFCILHHIQYNTCFWLLVKSGLSKQEANKALQVCKDHCMPRQLYAFPRVLQHFLYYNDVALGVSVCIVLVVF